MEGLAILVLCLSVIVASSVVLRLRFRRTAADRRANSLDDYVGYFQRLGISSAISMAVHRYLEEFTRVPKFPVQPTDDLYDVYGLCDDDLEAAVRDLVLQFRREPPVQAEILASKPVRNVEDLVVLVAALLRTNTTDDTAVQNSLI